MKYVILEESSTDKLEQIVKQHLVAGYILIGGIAVGVMPSRDDDGNPISLFFYCQAMYKAQ